MESSLCWGVLSVLAAEILQVRLERLVFFIAGIGQRQFGPDCGCALCRRYRYLRARRLGRAQHCNCLGKDERRFRATAAGSGGTQRGIYSTAGSAHEGKKAEVEQQKAEQREELSKEIAQLRAVIEKEKQERRWLAPNFSARIERDVTALQAKPEQEQNGLYDRLKQLKSRTEPAQS